MKIRSHIFSAVVMSCVLKTTVVPDRFSSSTASFNTSAFTGSRPENGSSRISRSGRPTIAAMNCAFCAMPFESVSIRLSPYAVRSKRASQRSMNASSSDPDRFFNRPKY